MASALLVNTGGLFDLNNFAQTVGSLANGPAGGGLIALGSAQLKTGSDNTNTLFSGIISGSGQLAKIGAGTQALGGLNTYTGATHILGGTLLATAPHVIAKQSAVDVSPGRSSI